jgi:RNA-directed DNA polymerase
MKSVARRVVDGALLHLIKMWLEAPVEETDERGNKHGSTRNRDEGRGTPQGSPVSPLLSNLYMRRFVLGWKKLGHEERWKAYIVNYADDLVICCRTGAQQALAAMRKPIFVWRLALRGADSILAAGLLYRRLLEHRRLYSLGTPSHSLLAQVDRPQVTNQQPGSSRPS